jgi:hypothetical protein
MKKASKERRVPFLSFFSPTYCFFDDDDDDNNNNNNNNNNNTRKTIQPCCRTADFSSARIPLCYIRAAVSSRCVWVQLLCPLPTFGDNLLFTRAK